MQQAPQLAREYELVYILRPSVSPSEARKVADRITDVLEKRGAKLTRVDNWGKRKLAYTIKKHTRGVFVYVKLVGFTDVVAELERNLRNLDEVMRYQTVRLEDVHDLTTLEVDPEEVQFRGHRDRGGGRGRGAHVRGAPRHVGARAPRRGAGRGHRERHRGRDRRGGGRARRGGRAHRRGGVIGAPPDHGSKDHDGRRRHVRSRRS
ncbi:MAG: 30S ribosomal protein S6 [Sandaracinaceae bacterium]|nr:30S ribosomal protein S6 [Sandaracinaceae bacterium]